MTTTKDIDTLFIYTPISVQERYGDIDSGEIGGYLPSLGLLSLAAYIRKQGYRVDVIDILIQKIGMEDLIAYIEETNPKAIGFSAITPIFHNTVKYAQRIKERFPDILIVIGGHHATILTEEVTRDNPCFDLVVFGEGEQTLLEIMDLYKAKNYQVKDFLHDFKSLSQVAGLAFRHYQKVIINSRRPVIEDVDQLPYPARDLVPMDKYVPLPNQYKRLPLLHMLVIRGCPFQCTFCSCNSVFGRKIRSKSPRKVVDEIRHLIDTYGARDISFWDDLLTVNEKWMTEVCDLIIQQKLDISWTCYGRTDCVSPQLLKKMAEAGCWNIFFGFETGTQELLDRVKKGISVEQMKKANRWCRDAGIEVRGSFMLGLPGETPELGQKTIDFAKELSPQYAQFSLTTPFPGTELFKEAEKWGRLDKDFSKYSSFKVVFVPFGYKDEDELKQMEKRAHFQFYFRLRAIIQFISKIRSWEDFKRHFKGFQFLLGLIK